MGWMFFSSPKASEIMTKRVAVYLETHCNIGSKTAFTTRHTRQVISYLWLWAAPALQCIIGQYQTTDVVEKLGKSLSGMQHTSHAKDFEVILTVKMETRHPVGGLFGREFSAFVIIAEL